MSSQSGVAEVAEVACRLSQGWRWWRRWRVGARDRSPEAEAALIAPSPLPAPLSGWAETSGPGRVSHSLHADSQQAAAAAADQRHHGTGESPSHRAPSAR